MMDSSGQIYVVDKERSQIEVYGISSQPQPHTTKETTTTKTSIKHTSESSSKDKSASNTLFITFTGFCCDYDGEVTVSLKNTETDKLMGKATFQVSDKDNSGKMTFVSKG